MRRNKNELLPLRLTFNHSRLATVAVPGFVPIYSGGTARAFHPLPLLERYTGQHNRREQQNLSSALIVTIYCGSFIHTAAACGRSASYGTIPQHNSILLSEEEYDRGTYV